MGVPVRRISARAFANASNQGTKKGKTEVSLPSILHDASGRWIISGVPEQAANSFLKAHSPWRMDLLFDSGPAAHDFGTYQPFNEFPLRKLGKIIDRIELPQNPSVLDIGFNCGYNSLFMATHYGGSVTGIDVAPKNKEVADSLATLLGVNVEFILEDAERFERPNTYDLVLHLGTLYHLPNPLLSLEKASRSLRPGGWLALETVRFLGDPNLRQMGLGLQRR